MASNAKQAIKDSQNQNEQTNQGPIKPAIDTPPSPVKNLDEDFDLPSKKGQESNDFGVPLMGPSNETLEDVLEGKDTKASLRGLAEFKQVQGLAASLKSPYFANIQSKKMQCFMLRLTNKSQDMLVIDGEKAVGITADGQKLIPLSWSTIKKNSGAYFTKSDYLALGLASIASIGLGETMVEERISNKNDTGIANGTNKYTRQIEANRLAQRFIMPQDFTQGYICFPCLNKGQVSSIDLPISSFADANISGQLSLTIGKDILDKEPDLNEIKTPRGTKSLPTNRFQ